MSIENDLIWSTTIKLGKEPKAGQFKSLGNGIKIYELSKICKPELVEIGDNSRIWDFVFIHPGEGVKIGKRCDIQTGVSITGGGSLEIRDDVSIGPGTRILTGEYRDQDDAGNGLAMTDFSLPHKAVYSHTQIDSHVYIGSGVQIRGGVHIGEGALVGMGSVVIKDVLPWTVVVGNPARKIRMRPCIKHE